ncbi:MAG TPA: tRNA preQ1(34) S-adenosylmethionine ribosyltransferase-isomerase QueA [Burkholderiaceae bacterium]|nr:tRNA preQ1(34) S-adenosylmethionine ribosyltransferase-isomerase QueA [Burkholderiaceae bacterium]
MNADLHLSQFDYDLPPELIAQHPAARRTASRLLYLDSHGALHDRQFTDFPDLLQPNDLLVFNDTRVIKARLTGHKETGGKVEVLVERVVDSHNALAHVRSSKAPRPGTSLWLAEAARATVTGREGELFALQFDQPVLETLEQYGATPLPPYITHAPDTHDEQRYQTVYARNPGAVAAPTAGLHFDADMLKRLDDAGIARAFVTLHVGAGTFQPVRVERLSEHVMHAERFEVPAETCRRITAARHAGGRVIAVGTTSARALESAAAQLGGPTLPVEAHAIAGDTRLFITPGHRFQWVDALLTNFHLPQSTLLMMVSALAGMDPIRRAYQHAIQSRYRFFSYGDAMFIEAP